MRVLELCRSYQYPSRRRPLRRLDDFDLTFDSDDDDDDDDDEVLEALFGYDPSPISFRRVRRPSSSGSLAARRGRKRLGGDRRRRWRQRPDVPGKLPRRTGGRATPRVKQATRSSRRPEKPAQQRIKPDVGSDTDSGRRVSLLHIVVSKQQDFAVPQPASGFVDHPGLLLEPRPLDVDALRSLAHHPFIQPFPPFLPVKPIVADTHQDRYVAYPITNNSLFGD